MCTCSQSLTMPLCVSEPEWAIRLPSTDWISGHHDTPLLQVHWLGTGEPCTPISAHLFQLKPTHQLWFLHTWLQYYSVSICLCICVPSPPPSLSHQLKQRQVTPPYKPRIDSDRDPSNFDPQFVVEPIDFTPDDPWVFPNVPKWHYCSLLSHLSNVLLSTGVC